MASSLFVARHRRPFFGKGAALGAAFVALLLVRGASAQMAADVPPPSDLEARLAALSAENQKIRERLAELERAAKENEATREKVEKLDNDTNYFAEQLQRLLPLSGKISGYFDFGFFRTTGNGAGVRPDIGYAHFPEYDGEVPDSWVFYGDPLSTMVNGRGEPADTGESRAITFDSIDNGGRSSFAVNALNMGIFAAVRDDLTMTASIDFVPRSRDVSAPNDRALGDFIDVKLAYVDYFVPISRFELTLSAGKIDSVLGWEYRSREAPDRLTVTPSLLCRYSCGAPLGLRARAKFWDGAVIANFALTNGSHVTENFPIYGEIDRNDWKTLAGRISSRAPIGAGLEVGVSGSIGAQDLQTDESVLHHHLGADVHLDWNDLDFTAEIMFGALAGKAAPGDAPCSTAPCLRYRGGYGQAGYRLTNWLMPFARVDVRDALHRSGQSFVYISQVLRATAGVRMELGPSVIIKAEYDVNRELGKAPQFPNDVFTSTMILKY